MTIENQTAPGLAASVTVGSLLEGSTANAAEAVGSPIGAAWSRENAFGLTRRFKREVILAVIWVAVGVGLIYLTGNGGPDWAIWVGCAMLALAVFIPFSLAIQYMKVATAGMLTRVYKPFSQNWMNAARAYEGKVGPAHAYYAVVFTLCLPFLALKEVKRGLTFVVRKLKGDNVQFGSREAVYNKRLGKALHQAVQTHGAEKADYLHYAAWIVLEVSPKDRKKISFENWKNGVRAEVVEAKTKAFGRILQR